MHPSYTDIFTILRQSLFPNEQDTAIVSPDADWDYIYQEMQDQAVSTLAYPWLKAHSLPDSELQANWMTSCLQQQTRWIQVMHAQDQLIQLMEKHSIPCVIIKGAAAMMAYPHPQLRAAGDIDFLVKREDYNKAAGILENNGYLLEQEKNADKHHYVYKKNGISLELHKRLGIIKDTDEELLSLFEKGIDNRTCHTIGNFRFPTLPEDLNSLVLLFHINQHLREGIGLRQIIDWMMYVYHSDKLNAILPLASLTGMEILAKTVTVMCQRYLGLPSRVEDSDDYPSDELMEYIVSKGNMGNKGGTEGKITSVSLVTTNPFQLFSRLQKGGMYKWNLAKKYKAFVPLAWLYQATQIVRDIIKNKVSIISLYKSQQVGSSQRDLLHKLGLDVEREIKDNHY